MPRHGGFRHTFHHSSHKMHHTSHFKSSSSFGGHKSSTFGGHTSSFGGHTTSHSYSGGGGGGGGDIDCGSCDAGSDTAPYLWSTSMFDCCGMEYEGTCCTDMLGMLDAMICYHCTMGQAHGRASHSSTQEEFVPGCETCAPGCIFISAMDLDFYMGTMIMGTILRGQLRSKYNIRGNCCEAFARSTFCPCCSAAQMVRELKLHGDYPGGYFSGPYPPEVVANFKPLVIDPKGAAAPAQQKPQPHNPNVTTSATAPTIRRMAATAGPSSAQQQQQQKQREMQTINISGLFQQRPAYPPPASGQNTARSGRSGPVSARSSSAPHAFAAGGRGGGGGAATAVAPIPLAQPRVPGPRPPASQQQQQQRRSASAQQNSGRFSASPSPAAPTKRQQPAGVVQQMVGRIEQGQQVSPRGGSKSVSFAPRLVLGDGQQRGSGSRPLPSPSPHRGGGGVVSSTEPMAP